MNSIAAPVASRRRMAVAGGSALRKLLDAERQSISRAPVLIISSGAGESGTFVSDVDHMCKRVEYHTSMQCGLRTVSSEVSSVFPLMQDVQARIDLAKRVGAETVIASGTKGAMDLAKSVIETHDNDLRGIFVPATYSAVLAAHSSHSLLFDPTEQGLVTQNAGMIDATVVVEPDTLWKVGGRHAVWASMAIGLDALHRGVDSPDVTAVLETTIKALQDEDSTVDAVAIAGSLISFGLSNTRSVPMAFAASLMPSTFPSSSMMTFMASLLPGIVHAAASPSSELEQKIHSHVESNSDIPSLAGLVKHGDLALSVPHLLSQVRRSRELWNCLDLGEDVHELILRYSLDR